MSLCVPFPSRSRDQYMSAIMLLLLLLFYCFIFSALHWPWYKYPLRRGRAGQREAALCPAPPQLFTPWQKHQPRCLQRLPRASRGRMVPTTQPAWDGRALTITPVTQERNQGVDGHSLPSPHEPGWTWGPSSWPVPELSLPCGRPGVPMEPALPLQARTFTQGTDRDP